METSTTDTVIGQTKRWIESVVIGCNFCPFAAKPFNTDAILYTVSFAKTNAEALRQVKFELYKLDDNEEAETSLLIFAEGFSVFEEYLDLVELAEALVADQDYEGIYQVASFHPAYLFAGSNENDPANYTNRSIYPMLHFLREKSVENSLEKFKDPDQIPERNVAFANQKGLAFMEQLRRSCIAD
jgi:uncharacterized protein